MKFRIIKSYPTPIALMLSLLISSHLPANAEQHPPEPLPPLLYISIDGGALLAFVPILLIEAIEKATQKPIYELVDGLMGSSSGGIVAACLSTPAGFSREPKFSAEQLKYAYSKTAEDSISLNSVTYLGRSLGSSLFSGLLSGIEMLTGIGLQNLANFETISDSFGSLLREQYGDTYLSHSLIHLMIATYNTEKQKLELFDSRKAKTDPSQDLKVWQAVRATTSLHFLFGPASVQFNTTGPLPHFIDGGMLGYNDPTAPFCSELSKQHPGRKIIVYSLGTGIGTSWQTQKYMDGLNPNIEVIRIEPDYSDREGTFVRRLLNLVTWACGMDRDGANLDINYLAGIPCASYIEYIKSHAAPLMATPGYKRMFRDLTGAEYIEPSR